MPRDPLQHVHRGGAPNADQISLRDGLFHLSAEYVASGGRVELLDVEVLNVEGQTGDGPGDAVVMTCQHARDSRQSHAIDIESRPADVDHVPGRRQAELQVRVAGQ